MFTILIVDDDKAICRSLTIQLEQEGHSVQSTHSVSGGLTLLGENAFDVAFLDLMLPDGRGLTILKALQESGSDCKGIMITGAQDMQATIEAVQYGAFDYIRKPLDRDSVFVTLEKVRQTSTSNQSQPLTGPVSERVSPHEIVGASRKTVESIKQIGVLSQNRVPVLIQGESGTGKELVARALHQASCPEKPFVALNCSAVVLNLLESELFGHEKGSFTGADSRKIGRLEYAQDGIIFFDEVGELAPEMQAKLLRALQEKTFERVGGTASLPLKARIVAATNRDLH